MPSCASRNCLVCNPLKNVCEQCKDGYILSKNRCYSTDCSVYGECNYCSEFDCIQCKKGFKVKSGLCEESDSLIYRRNLLLTGVTLTIIALLTIIITLTVLIIKKRKYRKNYVNLYENEKKTMANESNPNAKSRSYIIINPKNSKIIVTNNNISSNNNNNVNSNYHNINNNSKSTHCKKDSDLSINDNNCINNNSNSSNSSNNETSHSKTHSNNKAQSFIDTTCSKDICVLCKSNDIKYNVSSCGCNICENDYVMLERNESNNCPLHNVIINKDSCVKINVDRIETCGEKITCLNDRGFVTFEKVCPICKISAGCYGFGCACNKMVCAKCFHDFMNVYDLKQCPFCKMEYNPPVKKKIKKKRKGKEKEKDVKNKDNNNSK